MTTLTDDRGHFRRDFTKTRLVMVFVGLFTLFIVVETLILSWEYRESMIRDVVEQFNNQQVSLARQTASGIEKFLEDIMEDLELLSQYPALRGESQEPVTDILARFFRKNHDDVIHFYKLDASGVMTHIFPENEALGSDFSFRDYFVRTRESRMPHVSGFLKVQADYWTLVLTCPILGDENGVTVFDGLVAATVSVDKLRNRFFKPSVLSAGGYGWLLDDEGTITINPIHMELIGRDIASLFNAPGESGLKALTQRMKKGEEGLGQYSYEFVDKYAAFTPLKIGQRVCSVAICTPIDEVRQFMRSTFSKETKLLAFVIVAIIAAGGAMMFLTRRIYLTRMEEHSWAKLMGIYKAMSSGACIISPDRTVVLMNPALAKGLGLDEDRPARGACHALFMGRDVPCPECPMEDTRLQGGPGYALKRFTPESGRVFSAEVLTLPLSSPHGADPHVFCYIKNLTQEITLKKKLTQSQKMAVIGELSAGMAHEMRNPLLSICSASEMLVDSPNHDADETALARVIHTEARALEGVIREFLRYARPPLLNRTSLQLNGLVEKICQEARNRKDFRPGCRITTRLCPDLPMAYLDEGRLSGVLWNLIRNAGDAMDREGTIRISTAIRDDRRRRQLRLTVEDSGPGVASGLEERIFTPFFTTKEKGLGLGLALVQQAVEAHQGSIRYERTDFGSQFVILLPLVS